MKNTASSTEKHANSVAKIGLAIVPDNLYGESLEPQAKEAVLKFSGACLAK